MDDRNSRSRRGFSLLPGIAHAISFLLLCAAAASATIVYTSTSRDSLTVGDRIEYRVAIVAPTGAVVAPPATDQGFGNFVVKQWTSDKQQRSNSDSLTFSYVLTTYTVQPCSIPSLPFVQIHNGATDTLITQAVPMRVTSVITSDTADIKDLKAPQTAGSPSLLWLWILLGAALVAALVYGVKYLVDRRRKPAAGPPPQPPYEEAIAALAALDTLRFLQKGLVREYVFEVSDILKRYIERRYETLAAESTTEEMLDWIERSSLTRDQRACAEWFFRAADPVKFARFVPDYDTVHRFGPEVRRFLDLTRPIVAPDGAGDQERKEEKTGQAPAVTQGAGG